MQSFFLCIFRLDAQPGQHLSPRIAFIFRSSSAPQAVAAKESCSQNCRNDNASDFMGIYRRDVRTFSKQQSPAFPSRCFGGNRLKSVLLLILRVGCVVVLWSQVLLPCTAVLLLLLILMYRYDTSVVCSLYL